ncbi:hypothetical protein [Mycetocola miduiensis]|uniref:Uncharacterized protein n=1 Tax=Mycetocola miduiensis TaxID=995034 RepID=A0A1I5BKS2_9MICO|nr:hypothetical protein [Mycetocola miduiensis]SFN75081.1 hypothetical protein SAMN05216219_1934 [Mycetocola miduiensis]
MKTSTKNLLIGIVVVIVAVFLASVIVNVALAFLAAAFKLALIAFVALVLIAIGWAWLKRTRD